MSDPIQDSVTDEWYMADRVPRHRILSPRVRGAAAILLAGGLLVGGTAVSNPSSSAPPAPQASNCYIFAGKAGYLPCRKPDPQSQKVLRGILYTGLGCLSGLATGGAIGVAPGCLVGAAGFIGEN